MIWRPSLLSLFLALRVFAQPDVTTLDFGTQRQDSAQPYFKTVTVANASNATISIGSCVDVLLNLCASGSLQAPSLDPNATANPVKIRIFINATFGPASYPLVYQSKYTVTGAPGGSFDITVNLTVVAWTPATFRTIASNGACAGTGCSNSSSTYQDADVAGYSPARRPGGTYLPPTTPCTAFNDDQVIANGINKKVLLPPDPTLPVFNGSSPAAVWIQDQDSIRSPWNSDGTRLFVQNPQAFPFIVKISDCSKIAVGVGISGEVFHPTDPNTFYDFQNLTMYRNNINGPYHSTVEFSYTATGGATQFQTGGDSGIGATGDICFYTQGGTDNRLFVHNVITGATASTDYTSSAALWGGQTIPRFCNVAKGINQPDGKLYFILYGYSAGGTLYSLKNGVITAERNLPANPQNPIYIGSFGLGVFGDGTSGCTSALVTLMGASACLGNGGHFDTVGVDGVQYVSFVNQIGSGPVQYVFSRLDCMATSDNMIQPIENGGCAVYSFPVYLSPQNVDDDLHMGCSQKYPVCAFEADEKGGGTSGWEITGVDTGATTTVHFACHNCGTTLVNGNQVLINQVLGVTGLTGSTPVSVTIGSVTGTQASGTFVATGINSTGSSGYVSGSGTFILDVTPTSGSHQGELFLVDLSNLTSTNPTTAKTVRVTRLGKHRSLEIYNDRTNSFGAGYYDAPHVNISPDGTKISWISNYGIPDYLGLYMMDTGFTPGTGGRFRAGPVTRKGPVSVQ